MQHNSYISLSHTPYKHTHTHSSPHPTHTCTSQTSPTRSSLLSIEDSTSKHSTTEDSPAPPRDDESFYSATEELDEPVGPPPTATDESTTVQSPHRMDQQETSEDKCKSLLCLEQSGRASLLIICTHFSLLCVLTCFISTVSSDGTAEVTTPPQTTPFPHDTLSGMAIS